MALVFGQVDEILESLQAVPRQLLLDLRPFLGCEAGSSAFLGCQAAADAQQLVATGAPVAEPAGEPLRSIFSELL